ncbi:MAG: hypothetical protein DCC75_07905 [Proteobacteria bacterium]|nr:MAG: hypothetical protein DCC75_07905 [Pseudomonadota bacterium]
MTSAALALLGLLVLVAGGEILLRGAVGLANWYRLSPAVVGLTVVAAATSVPELAVSLIAGIEGKNDIALGNVVGSNICNIGLVLGLSAIIRGLSISGNSIKLEYPVMAIVTFLLVVVGQDGTLARLESLLLLLIYVCFTAYMIRVVRTQLAAEEAKEFTEHVATLEESSARPSRSAAYVIVSVLLLALGAELTVSGAVGIARIFGLSERVIGLTIVAIGTSSPEIVASIISSLRCRDYVAVGNVIGSNIFNILVILGLSGLVSPLAVSPDMILSDFWWMLGVALLLFPLMRSGMRITRREGSALLMIYAVYLTLLIRS